MALSSAQKKILSQDVKAGDRLGYYNHLFEFGSEYGTLAAGVVTAETDAGAAANLFLLNTARADGVKISNTTLAKIGFSLMQADFQARKDGHELDWKEIQAYHNSVFKSYGVPVDSWTPNFILKAKSLTYREKADYWDHLMDATGKIGSIGAYWSTYKYMIAEYGFDVAKTKKYELALNNAGIDALVFSSNERGSSTLLLRDGGKVIGGNHNDNALSGTARSDVLMGFDGKDVLYGGGGADRLYGGWGSDLFKFKSGDVEKGETINGGSLGLLESNQISAEGRVDFRSAIISNINIVTALAGAELHFSGKQIDALVADGAAFAGAGDILIDANGASQDFSFLNARITDLSGSVILNGTVASDTVTGTLHSDVIFGQDGSDTLHGMDGSDLVYGGAGSDVLYGGSGNDTLNGGDGADTIFGGDGDDVIDYDTPDSVQSGESVDGGAGSDRIRIGGSVIVEFSDIQFVSIEGIQLTGSSILEIDLEESNFTGTISGSDDSSLWVKSDFALSTDQIVGFWTSSGMLVLESLGNVTGSQLAESIIGSGTLIGAGGDDYIVGSSQRDIIYGGAGDDIIYDNSLETRGKSDIISGGDGDDEIHAGGVISQSLGVGVGGPTVDGGAGNDTIYMPWGGTVTVGSGQDTLIIDTAWDVTVIDFNPAEDSILIPQDNNSLKDKIFFGSSADFAGRTDLDFYAMYYLEDQHKLYDVDLKYNWESGEYEHVLGKNWYLYFANGAEITSADIVFQ